MERYTAVRINYPLVLKGLYGEKLSFSREIHEGRTSELVYVDENGKLQVTIRLFNAANPHASYLRSTGAWGVVKLASAQDLQKSWEEMLPVMRERDNPQLTSLTLIEISR